MTIMWYENTSDFYGVWGHRFWLLLIFIMEGNANLKIAFCENKDDFFPHPIS